MYCGTEASLCLLPGQSSVCILAGQQHIGSIQEAMQMSASQQASLSQSQEPPSEAKQSGPDILRCCCCCMHRWQQHAAWSCRAAQGLIPPRRPHGRPQPRATPPAARARPAPWPSSPGAPPQAWAARLAQLAAAPTPACQHELTSGAQRAHEHGQADVSYGPLIALCASMTLPDMALRALHEAVLDGELWYIAACS